MASPNLDARKKADYLKLKTISNKKTVAAAKIILKTLILAIFVLPPENQNAFARSADFEFQFILYSRIETARHLVRSDLFAKIYTKL